MSKFLSLFTAVAFSSFIGVAGATPVLTVDPAGTSPDNTYAIFLDLGDQNGQFNTFRVSIDPGTGRFEGHNPTGAEGTTALMPGDDASFTNALIPAPPLFGGLGLTVVGDSEGSDAGFAYSVTLPGAFFDISEPIFLNNVVLSGQGQATVELFNGNGEIFSTLSAPIGIPEPTSFALAGLSLVSVLAVRRQRS